MRASVPSPQTTAPHTDPGQSPTQSDDPDQPHGHSLHHTVILDAHPLLGDYDPDPPIETFVGQSVASHHAHAHLPQVDELPNIPPDSHHPGHRHAFTHLRIDSNPAQQAGTGSTSPPLSPVAGRSLHHSGADANTLFEPASDEKEAGANTASTSPTLQSPSANAGLQKPSSPQQRKKKPPPPRPKLPDAEQTSTEGTGSIDGKIASINYPELIGTARQRSGSGFSGSKGFSWGSGFVRKLRSYSVLDMIASSFATPTESVIDRLLESENVVVEDFLLYEDLMVEFTSRNKPLLEFLSRMESLSNMISYVITPCSDQSLTARYADVSFELLHSGDMALLHTLFQNGGPLWDCFLAVLTTKEPLGPRVASQFTRLLSKFFSIKPRETWYQIRRTGSFRLLLNHISEPAMLSMLQSFVVVLHLVPSAECVVVIDEWKKNNPIIDCVRAFHDATNAEDHSNICILIKEFLESQGLYSSSVMHMCSKVYMEIFLEAIFTGPFSCLKNGLPILSFLMTNYFKIQKSTEAPPHFECFVPHLRTVSTMLELAPTKKFTNSVATYDPPLGTIRFNLIEVVEILTRCNSPKVHEKIIEYSILDKIINLFFKYTWNNLLHNRVVYIIHHAFEYQYDEIITALFRPSLNLLGRLVDQATISKGRSGCSEQIMQIIGIIETAADESQLVLKHTTANAKWTKFVESVAERDGEIHESDNGDRPKSGELRKSITRFTPPRW